MRDLKRLGLWDDVMVMDLKHFDGSLRPIDRVPQEVKALYATAFEVEPQWLVEAAARRQKWIDQAQSLNIYMAGASGKKLDETYKLAWLRGLKTTYYLRTMRRDARREVHGAERAAERGVDRRGGGGMSRARCGGGRSARADRTQTPAHRHQVLRDRRPDVRGLSVSDRRRPCMRCRRSPTATPMQSSNKMRARDVNETLCNSHINCSDNPSTGTTLC